jgi:hypothetical protein
LCNGSRVDLEGFPPSSLIATIVELTVMPTAQWDGELVADLAPERARLGEAQMVGF